MSAYCRADREKHPFAAILALVVVLLFALTVATSAQSGSATFAVVTTK